MIKRRVFFSRLLALYFIIILLYTIVASGVMLFKSQEIYENEILANKKLLYNQFSYEIDTKIRIAYNLVTKIKNDANIREYLANNSVDAHKILLAHKELANIQNSFSNMNFYLGISHNNSSKILSSIQTSTLQYYFDDFGANNITIDFIREKMQKSTSTLPYFTMVTGNYLTIVKSEISDTGKDFYVYVTFEIGKLFPVDESLEKTLFAVVDRDTNEILFTSNKKENENLLKIHNSGETARKYNGYFLNSKIIKWDFIYKYNQPKFDFGILIPIFTLFFILLICGAVAALFFVNVSYKPLNKLINSLKPYNDSKNTYDEIKYIEETTRKINEANSKLRQSLDKHKIPEKANFLSKLISGLISGEEAGSYIERNNIIALQGGCRLTIMELNDYGILEEKFSKKDILEIQLQIIDIMKSMMTDYCAVEAIELDYRRFVILTSEIDEKLLQKLLKNIILTIEADFYISFTATLGNVCDSYMEISNSFDYAIRTIENSYYFNHQSIVTIGDNKGNVDSFYYSIDTEKELISLVVKNNKEHTIKLIEKIVWDNFENKIPTKQALSGFTFAITNTVNRILQILGKNADEVFEDGALIYFELKMKGDNQSVKTKIFEIFNKLLLVVDSQTKQIDGQLKEMMLDYIHKNYKHDIALADLADHLNFSRTYISTLFKEFIGYNFKDYLNLYRISEAKRILTKNPKLKVNDVGMMVGFNSANTFIRLFNKYEQTSPGQYVKDIILKQE